jgi:plasmid stabilization system protein ParE
MEGRQSGKGSASQRRMKQVIRTTTYLDDLDQIESYIARDNPQAAAALWEFIDGQVEHLADPRFPRRKGRVPRTFELVAHKNYIVVFQETDLAVIVLNVVHVKRRYP